MCAQSTISGLGKMICRTRTHVSLVPTFLYIVSNSVFSINIPEYACNYREATSFAQMIVPSWVITCTVEPWKRKAKALTIFEQRNFVIELDNS